MENVRNIVEGGMLAMELVGNYNSLDEKMGTLKRKLEQLSSRQKDVNAIVENADLHRKKRKSEVENWSKNVERIKNEVRDIEQARQESGVISRFKLGNRVEKLIGDVAKLVDQGGFPQGLTLDVMETRDPFVTTKLVGKEFQRYLDKIWESIMNVNVLSIGIHGMGGVGKTTLVMHIHNRLLENRDTFNVCWVSVSQDFSIRKLQNDIANDIKLDLSNEVDEKKIAAKLAQALRRKKKLVLILDDIWERFSPEEVGIPVEVNVCKLILTTRFSNVCRSMGCQENVTVMPLNEGYSWDLFMEKFGHGIALPVEIEDIARSIVKECAGLPLGITTVAGSMRGLDIDIHVWRNALEELKHSKAGLDGLESKVFGVLKFSYSSLKDPKLKECFLYCSLYSEDFKIERDELIDILIDVGIIERMERRQIEFDKGHAMLNKLVNAYLLEGVEDIDKNKCVKMHDLVRDMAIQIARARHGFMVEVGKGLRDFLVEAKWKDDLDKVSLMSNKFSKIPSNASPKCPKLSTLMLNHNDLRGGIPNSFFEHMSGLKVLNLSYTTIKDMPDSVFNLENLTALLLRRCGGLKHVPSVAKLIALRRLDLESTRIKEIPQGLEMLVNLRYLNLKSTLLKTFPTGILPKLSHLQHLAVDCKSETSKVKGEEVACLKKLETFEGQFYDIQGLSTYARSLEEGGPSNYRLQVGIDLTHYIGFNIRGSRKVILTTCSISKSRGGEDSLVLPKDVQSLVLIGVRDLTSLCNVPSLNNVVALKEILVWLCEGIDHILWSSSSPVPPGTFSQLKVFILYDCNNIKVFMPKLLLHLHNLEEIHIINCDKLVEIIEASSDEVEEEEEDHNDERNKEEGMDNTIFYLPKLRLNFHITESTRIEEHLY